MGVEVEVEVVELLLLEPVAVATLARHVLAGAVGQGPLLRCALYGQSAVHEAHTYARGKPFAHSHVERPAQAVAEVGLLVVVAEGSSDTFITPRPP